MKTRLLIVIVMIMIPLIFPQGFSQCIYNDDWPDAPCFDMGPASHHEFKKAWAPYYDYKGTEWMEAKKVEMNQSLEQGVLEKWAEKIENYNVYHYYLSRNEIPSQLQDDRFFVRLEPNFGTTELMQPESVIDDPCGPTGITNSDICNPSLSLYPIIVIVAFVLIVGLFVYLFTLGKRK